MVMVTLWLSMARGGTVFSSGMSSPWAWTLPAPASSTATTGKNRRMGGSFRELRHLALLRYSDESSSLLDCRATPTGAFVTKWLRSGQQKNPVQNGPGCNDRDGSRTRFANDQEKLERTGASRLSRVEIARDLGGTGGRVQRCKRHHQRQ